MVRIIKNWGGEKFYATYDCGSFTWTQNEAKAYEFKPSEGEAAVIHLTGTRITSGMGGIYSLEVVNGPNTQPRAAQAINDAISAERERCVSLIDIAVTHRDDDSLDTLRKRILSGATKW